MNVLRRMQARNIAKKLLSGEGRQGPEIAELQNQLVAMGSAAIAPVFEALRGGSSSERAGSVLDRLLTNDSLPEFVQALHSQQLVVLDAAVAVLARGRSYDPGRLLTLITDPDVARARLEAILMAQVQSIPPRELVRMLTEVSRDARGCIVRLLEKRADANTGIELARHASHEDWEIRLSVLKILSRIPGPLAGETATVLLKDTHPMVRLEAVRCLGALKVAGAIPALCARLRDSDLKVQTAAIEALIAIGDARAVVSLLEYLKDESEYVRRGAVEVLNRVVTVEAIKDLVAALRDADWWVRVRAADALGTLGGERVVEGVMGLLEDADEFVRRYAVEILIMVPDTRAVAPLVRALEDDDWWVRERAIDALAKAGDARAVEPLIRMIERDPQAIPACVRALGAIGDLRAIEPLCRLSTSPSEDVRRTAIEALQVFATKELGNEERAEVFTALEVAGVRRGARTAAPLENRRGFGPESGHTESPARTPARTPAPRPAEEPAATAPPARASGSIDPRNLEPGVVLGERFRVVRQLGSGGFGTVYLVEDTVVCEQIALKILSPHLWQDDSMIRRFVQELKLTRRITHRNVIRIHEFLELSGARAISMEYFQGRDLGKILKEEGPLAPERTLHIAEQVLGGLAAAHELGIVHRDIKPANLLVGADDMTKIVDFGLAAAGQASQARLTQSGIVMGTPEFIAPEQIRAGELDGRADLYSFGCVLYLMLSGREPFRGADAVKTLFLHLEGTATPLAEIAPDVPPGLSDLVMQLLARNRDDRPAGAAETVDALGALRRAA